MNFKGKVLVNFCTLYAKSHHQEVPDDGFFDTCQKESDQNVHLFLDVMKVGVAHFICPSRAVHDQFPD